MCKSVLHKHATQEFIAFCLTRELGIIIKISFTEKKNIKKKLQYKTFKVIIFTLLGVFGRVRVCVFLFRVWMFAVIRSRSVCTLGKDRGIFTSLDFHEGCPQCMAGPERECSWGGFPRAGCSGATAAVAFPKPAVLSPALSCLPQPL